MAEWDQTVRIDTEIKMDGFEILSSNLEIVEAERFIAPIQKEKFDYTKCGGRIFSAN